MSSIARKILSECDCVRSPNLIEPNQVTSVRLGSIINVEEGKKRLRELVKE